MSNLIELQPMPLPSEYSKAFVALKNVDIYYIGSVGKISQKGQVKNRVLVIVSEQLFSCYPNGGITTPIRLTEMKGLLVKKSDIVVRTHGEDLWLRFPNEQISNKIVRILQGLYYRGTMSDLPYTIVPAATRMSSHGIHFQGMKEAIYMDPITQPEPSLERGYPPPPSSVASSEAEVRHAARGAVAAPRTGQIQQYSSTSSIPPPPPPHEEFPDCTDSTTGLITEGAINSTSGTHEFPVIEMVQPKAGEITHGTVTLSQDQLNAQGGPIKINLQIQGGTIGSTNGEGSSTVFSVQAGDDNNVVVEPTLQQPSATLTPHVTPMQNPTSVAAPVSQQPASIASSPAAAPQPQHSVVSQQAVTQPVVSQPVQQSIHSSQPHHVANQTSQPPRSVLRASESSSVTKAAPKPEHATPPQPHRTQPALQTVTSQTSQPSVPQQEVIASPGGRVLHHQQQPLDESPTWNLGMLVDVEVPTPSGVPQRVQVPEACVGNVKDLIDQIHETQSQIRKKDGQLSAVLNLSQKTSSVKKDENDGTINELLQRIRDTETELMRVRDELQTTKSKLVTEKEQHLSELADFSVPPVVQHVHPLQPPQPQIIPAVPFSPGARLDSSRISPHRYYEHPSHPPATHSTPSRSKKPGRQYSHSPVRGSDGESDWAMMSRICQDISQRLDSTKIVQSPHATEVKARLNTQFSPLPNLSPRV